MHAQFEYITNQQYEVKRLKKLVEAFQSGEKYVRMEKEFRKSMNGLRREIRSLKAALAAAHAETVKVRSLWIQACEDLEKEKDGQLARKEREFQTALFKMAYEKSRDDQKLILKLSARQFLLIVLCAIFIGALCFGSHLQSIPEEAFSSMPVSDIDKPEKMCYTEPYDNNAGSLSPQNLP